MYPHVLVVVNHANNLRSSLRVFGAVRSLIACTFFGNGWIPSRVIQYLRAAIARKRTFAHLLSDLRFLVARAPAQASQGDLPMFRLSSRDNRLDTYERTRVRP